MIFLGADHYGHEYKSVVKEYLENKGYEVTDLGTDSAKEVDYPEYAKAVAERVSEDPYSRGILFSRTGLGMCIAANKVKGIFAALIYNEKLSEKSREENDTNILCLPTEYISEQSAKEIVSIWLSTSFSGSEESSRHISQIRGLEKNG